MDYLREAELKHGRICMMAWLGFISVDLGARIYPLPEAYAGLTSVTAHDALLESGAMGQMLVFIGLGEIISWLAISEMLQVRKLVEPFVPNATNPLSTGKRPQARRLRSRSPRFPQGQERRRRREDAAPGAEERSLGDARVQWRYHAGCFDERTVPVCLSEGSRRDCAQRLCKR